MSSISCETLSNQSSNLGNYENSDYENNHHNEEPLGDDEKKKEEVFKLEQFILDEETNIPDVTKQNSTHCEELREIGALINMADFETNPLEFWFLTRLVEILGDTQMKEFSQDFQKSLISWIGYMFYQILNTELSRVILFEQVNNLLLSSLSIFIEFGTIPMPLDITKRQGNRDHSETPKQGNGDQSETPEQTADSENSDIEQLQKEMEYLTTWIYQMFADSCTFESIRLMRDILPMEKRKQCRYLQP